MQKVSKQSLAMLALSILLAISIALTFTFAALSDSKTATGTVTFSKGFTLTSTGFSGSGSDTFTITPTIADTGNVSYAINETTAAWTIANNDTNALIVEITFTWTSDAEEGFDPATIKNVVSGTTYKLSIANAKTATINLADVVALETDNTITDIEGLTDTKISYTIEIDVKVVSSSSNADLPEGVATVA